MLSISLRSSSMSMPLVLAISSRGIFLSTLWMMKTLLTDLLTMDFMTKSSGRSISFSSTYLAMSSINSLPNFLALPSPTPWQFLSSSYVIGYMMDISSSDGSPKMTQGWSLSLRATSLRRSLSMLKSWASPPPPLAAAAALSSSSSSPSTNSLSSVSISSYGFSRNLSPSSVAESRP